jgi:hypothetical protein
MPEVTIASDVPTVATGGVFAAYTALIAVLIGAMVSLYTANAETRRRRWEYRAKRRDERQETYQTAIDLLTDWGWRRYGQDPDYEVVRDFTVPFVRVANRVRVYGSPASIAAMDEIQEGFARLNRAEGESEHEAADEAIGAGHDHLVMAARADVGPRKDDGLKDVPYRQGAGPSA